MCGVGNALQRKRGYGERACKEERRLNRGFWFLRRRGRRLTSGGGLLGEWLGNGQVF